MKKLLRPFIAGLGLLFITAYANAYTLGPTTPGKWGSPIMGTGATITWSLMGSGLAVDGTTSVGLDTFLPTGYLTEIQKAFDAWSAVANITFVQALDPGVGWQSAGADAVDIRITGHTFDGPSGTLAHALFPPSNGGSAAGDLHLDTAETWKIGFGGAGFDIFQVVAHEIGHSLGLDHSSVAGSLMNPFYTEAFSGVQADDAAGAQFIYGGKIAVSEPGIISLFILGILGFSLFRRKQWANNSL